MENEYGDYREEINENGERVRIWNDDLAEPEDRPEWHEMGS